MIALKEEIVLNVAEKKWIFNKDGSFTDIVQGKKPFIASANLARDPQYIAIPIKGESAVRIIAEIDYSKSDLRTGKIWLQNAIPVNIPIRFGKDTLENIRYTTFKKLVTHKNTDEL